MAYENPYEIGTADYSQSLSDYLNNLSQEELLALGNDFDVSGLARADLGNFNPYNESGGLAYTPEDLATISRYQNIEGADFGTDLSAGQLRYASPDAGFDDKGNQAYSVAPLWATRNKPGSEDYLYEYDNNGNLVPVSYNEKDSWSTRLKTIADPIGTMLNDKLPGVGFDSLNPITIGEGNVKALGHQWDALTSGSPNGFLESMFAGSRDFTQAHPFVNSSADYVVNDLGIQPMDYLDQISSMAGSIGGGAFGPIGGAIAGGVAGIGLGSQFGEDEDWKQVYEAAAKGAATGAISGYAKDLSAPQANASTSGYDPASMAFTDAEVGAGSVGSAGNTIGSQALQYAKEKGINAMRDMALSAINGQPAQPNQGNSMSPSYKGPMLWANDSPIYTASTPQLPDAQRRYRGI